MAHTPPMDRLVCVRKKSQTCKIIGNKMKSKGVGFFWKSIFLPTCNTSSSLQHFLFLESQKASLLKLELCICSSGFCLY